MDDDIAHQLDSFSLNEEESIYAKFSNTEVESKQEACEHSTFLVIYGGGVINALGFKTAMLRPWQREGHPFVIHSLPDNVFQIIFPSLTIKEYVLKHEPWNFDNKLINMHLWSRDSPSPLAFFDCTHI